MATSRRDFLKQTAAQSVAPLITIPLVSCRSEEGGSALEANQWIAIGSDSDVSLVLDKVEMGQGVNTPHRLITATVSIPNGDRLHAGCSSRPIVPDGGLQCPRRTACGSDNSHSTLGGRAPDRRIFPSGVHHVTLRTALATTIATFTIAPALTIAAQTPAPTLSIAPYKFSARDGTVVDAELGSFQVPENRANPASRQITISFVRFKSTSSTPSDPIVYLAGGPGGSGIGTATAARFPVFMALRAVGDVIALDQRGTGRSNQIPFCAASVSRTPDTPLTRSSLIEHFRAQAATCFDRWKASGVDIDGYTTRENAHDLEDLRRALGAERINLWGISYGSHLGLAALKYHGANIERAVFAGIEGLDQTVKRPALTDDLLARVQTLIDQDPVAKAAYPDLVGTMRRVHGRLNREPARVAVTPIGATAPVTITFDAFPLQMLVGGMISDPAGIAQLPAMYRELDQGKLEQLALRLQQQFLSGRGGVTGMPEAMDLASGITTARLALIEREARTSVLGDALNFPVPHALGVRPALDLGDDFRAPFKSATPVLFISGTLDGRTYVPEAQEEIKGFSRATHLIVENGGHNIFEADQRVANAVVAFFRGEGVPATIRLAPPAFRP